MTITGVSPNPVPAGQTTTVTYTGLPAIRALVVINGTPVKVPVTINGNNTVTVGPFPGAGNYDITLFDRDGNSDTAGATAQ